MKILYIFLVFVSGTVSVSAGGLSYADKQVFSHGYVDFDRTGPLALPEYPWAQADSGMVIQASYRSLYDIRELTDNRVGMALSRGSVTGGAGLSSFGEADYFHQLGLAGFFAYRYNRFRFGMSLIYSRLSFGGNYDYLSSITANIGAAFYYHNGKAFIVGRSLNQPRYYKFGRPIDPEVECGITYRTPGGLDSHAKALFIRSQKPSAELSQSFSLADYASLNWALVLEPVRFGGGLHLEHGHIGFDYLLSHHPVLGLTHTVTLTIMAYRRDHPAP